MLTEYPARQQRNNENKIARTKDISKRNTLLLNANNQPSMQNYTQISNPENINFFLLPIVYIQSINPRNPISSVYIFLSQR